VQDDAGFYNGFSCYARIAGTGTVEPRKPLVFLAAKCVQSHRMTFGFSSVIDLLSWAIVALLGLKVSATVILLRRDKQTWFRHRWSGALWWSTKITPLLAVPCIIAVAMLQYNIGDAWGNAEPMLFVLIALPVVISRRFYRRTTASGDLSTYSDLPQADRLSVDGPRSCAAYRVSHFRRTERNLRLNNRAPADRERSHIIRARQSPLWQFPTIMIASRYTNLK
jgi:hypothetical protein